VKKLFFILFFSPSLLFAQQDSTKQTFKVRSVVPTLKVLYSKSNSLYIGTNEIILTGIDSASANQYRIFTDKHVGIQKKNNLFFLSLGDNVLINPGSPVPIKISIIKTNGKDTTFLATETLFVMASVVPEPKLMIGKTVIDPVKIEKKLLLRNPQISFTSPSPDFDTLVYISRFDIKIGGPTIHCNLDALSNDALTTLKGYGGNYVTITKVYIKGAFGELQYYPSQIK